MKIKSLTNKFFAYSCFFNSVSVFIIYIFIFLIFSASPKQLLFGFLINLASFSFMHFIVYFLILKISNKKLDNLYLRWKENKLDINTRTMFFKKFSKLPITFGIISFLFFFTYSILTNKIYQMIPSVRFATHSSVFSYFFYFYASIVLSTIQFYSVEKRYSPELEKVLDEGIDTFEIKNKKKNFFGLSLTSRFINFIIIPIVIANIISFLVLYHGYKAALENFLGIRLFSFTILFTLLNFTVLIILDYLYFEIIKSNLKKQEKITSKLLTKSSSDSIKTALNSEMQYNIYLLNEIISKYNSIIKSTNEITVDITQTSTSLSIISNQIYATSQEQNINIKSLLDKMYDSNSLSKSISTKANKISEISNKTTEEIQEIFTYLTENINQIKEIELSNKNIVNEINNLNIKIKKIYELITLIHEISEQTKIIALNTELDSKSIETEKNNYHIIALEIQKLAKETDESLEEIQKYINNITESSNDLMEAANTENSIIDEEINMIESLDIKFKNMQEIAQDCNDKTIAIHENIKRQEDSFDQIELTLKELSSGLDIYTNSTDVIKKAANTIQTTSNQLNDIFIELPKDFV